MSQKVDASNFVSKHFHKRGSAANKTGTLVGSFAGPGTEFRCVPDHLVTDNQGFHTSWKVLDFFLKIPGPGKSWKITLVLESPGKVLDFFLSVKEWEPWIITDFRLYMYC